jgi:hypothetical protein
LASFQPVKGVPVAHLKVISAGPLDGIAEPHQSCVATILRAARDGLFTEAEADLLVDRIRALNVRLAERTVEIAGRDDLRIVRDGLSSGQEWC